MAWIGTKDKSDEAFISHLSSLISGLSTLVGWHRSRLVPAMLVIWIASLHPKGPKRQSDGVCKSGWKVKGLNRLSASDFSPASMVIRLGVHSSD